MKLLMPIRRNALPTNNVFVAGQEYIFPFDFVLPFHLTIGSCRHKCASPAVKEQHLRPPPTMGFWEEADDQSPQMTQIKYAITVLATRTFPVEFLPAKVIAESCMIKVLPAFPEDAPLDITPMDDRYALSRSKTIRKNFVASKLGRLTATAAQPKAVMLSPDGHVASGSSCRLTLSFDSIGIDTPPPKINSVSGKLTSHTFFDISFMYRLPNLGGQRTFETMAPYQYTTSNRIFNLPMGDLSWREENVESTWENFMFPSSEVSSEVVHENSHTNDAGESTRRVSAATCPDMSTIAAGSRRHVSVLDIQFTIPNSNRRMFLPTFHSCRISRTYTLDLCLSVGQTFSTVTLVVPLQIGVERDDSVQQRLQRSSHLASIRGQEHGRRNTYAGLPGYMIDSSDNEPPGYF